YIDLVSFTLLYYDYALTLPAEIDRFWSTRSLSWTSTFFYLNRYLSLFGHIPAIVRDFWMPVSSDKVKVFAILLYIVLYTQRMANVRCECASLAVYHQYLIVIIQVIVGILLIIRTYALYDRNLRVLLFTCACGLAVIIFGTWSVTAEHDATAAVIDPQIACIPALGRDNANRLANAWIGMLLFDVLIFSMTMYRSWSRGDRVRSRSLFKVLLCDGAIYFGIMVVVELVTVVTFRVFPGYQRGSTATLATIVSSTMINRLMLNLRDPKYSMELTYPRYHLSALNFNTASSYNVIGSHPKVVTDLKIHWVICVTWYGRKENSKRFVPSEDSFMLRDVPCLLVKNIDLKELKEPASWEIPFER
ncbi:hypothetical protein E4T56_gene6226, partial [Termitomyces sp. T112]